MERVVETKPAATGKFLAGDSLRTVAAIYIILFHVTAAASGARAKDGLPTGLPHWYEVFLGKAVISVYLFFGLSGYLIGRPWLRAFILERRQPRIGAYAGNRALRIVPVLVVVFFVTLLRFGKLDASWPQIVSHLFFAQLYVKGASEHWALWQAWTLDVELLFYIALPALVIFALRRYGGRGTPGTRLAGVLAFLTVISVASVLCQPHGNPYVPQSMVFTFGFGLAAAALEPFIAERVLNARVGRIAGWSALAVMAGLLVYYYWVDWSIPMGRATGTLALFALFLGLLFYQAGTGRMWRALDNRPMNWLGERSYSLYMWHMFVTRWMGDVLPHGGSMRGALALQIAVDYPVMIVLATVSYRYIERPFLNRRFEWRREPTRGPTDLTPAPEPLPATGTPAPVPAPAQIS